MHPNRDNLSGSAQIGVKVEQRNTVSSIEEVIAGADTVTLRRLLQQRVHGLAKRLHVSDYTLLGLLIDRAYELLGS